MNPAEEQLPENTPNPATEVLDGEIWFTAFVAGLLTLCLVGLLEYWLLRPHFVGDMSYFERRKQFPREETEAKTKAWSCGLSCGLAVSLGIVGLAYWKWRPHLEFLGRRVVIKRGQKISLGSVYGFIAGFWIVSAIAGPPSGDLSDRMLGWFRIERPIDEKLAGLGPPLCGIICSVMTGLHLSLMYPKKPESKESQISTPTSNSVQAQPGE